MDNVESKFSHAWGLAGRAFGLAVIGGIIMFADGTVMAQSLAARASAAELAVKYELPVLDKIPEAVAKIRADAAAQKGEGAAVLRAWAAHLDKLHAVHTNALLANSRLRTAYLLEPAWVTDFNDSEGVRRRGLANKYAEAWHELDHALATFDGSFYGDLNKEQVSPERTAMEARAISALVQQPETAPRIASLRKYCQAEEQVGRGYNYACSKVFDFARIAHNAPDAAQGFRTQMNDELAKLRETEQAATQARREAVALLESKR